jgi:hypothetical protein
MGRPFRRSVAYYLGPNDSHTSLRRQRRIRLCPSLAPQACVRFLQAGVILSPQPAPPLNSAVRRRIAVDGGFCVAHQLPRVQACDFDRGTGVSTVRPPQPTQRLGRAGACVLRLHHAGNDAVSEVRCAELCAAPSEYLRHAGWACGGVRAPLPRLLCRSGKLERSASCQDRRSGAIAWVAKGRAGDLDHCFLLLDLSLRLWRGSVLPRIGANQPKLPGRPISG